MSVFVAICYLLTDTRCLVIIACSVCSAISSILCEAASRGLSALADILFNEYLVVSQKQLV